MFFLKLPNTGITLDLPVIAYEPREPRADAPLFPDIEVAPDLDARARGEDQEMRAVRAAIATRA